jgi:hypothetical protein
MNVDTPVTLPPGLLYFENCVPKELTATQRLVKLDFSAEGTPCESIKCYSTFLSALQRIAEKKILDAKPEVHRKEKHFKRYSIKKYKLGEGHDQFTNSVVYGEYICIFTFGSDVMITYRREGKKDVEVHVRDGSLQILSGEARYVWSRKMKARKYDVFDGVKTPRHDVYTVTFSE